MFCLIVENFGVDYVGKQHAIHLNQALAEHYELTENWKGDLYSSINLEWNYDPIHSKHTVRLTMDDYIANLRVKYDHPDPRKPQHSPYKHTPIIYGTKLQYASEDNDSPTLDADGILRVQSILGALLLYGWAVDNGLLVELSELGQQQGSATQATNYAILQLIDYVSDYPRYGITFRSSDMILSSHSEEPYLNVTKTCSRAGAHIILSEDVPLPTYNGPIITIAQIIRNTMSSAAESKLSGLLICAK